MQTKPPTEMDTVIKYLTDGYWQWAYGNNALAWPDSSLIYSFDSSWTNAEEQALATALDAWAEVAAVSFVEADNNGDIRFVQEEAGRNGYYAYSQSWGYGNTRTSSEVRFNIDSFDTAGLTEPGSYEYMTALHEIGHSLGLGHSGPYDGGGSYNRNAIFETDTQEFSLMSYWWEGQTGADHNGQEASTPLLYDIAAVQNVWGANTTTRAGDTTYGFNTTGLEGNSALAFSANTTPVVTLWDAGGIDTLDLSGYSTRQNVSLNPGSINDVGTRGATETVAIALDTWIENVVGGSGNDTLKGNTEDNILIGGDGNDNLDGNSGNDTVVFDGLYSDYDIVVENDVCTVSGVFTDTVTDVEYFQFDDITLDYAALSGGGQDDGLTQEGGDSRDTLHGTGGNDQLYGHDRNDTLYGYRGADRLYGGDNRDTLVGNRGDDILDGGRGNDLLLGGDGNDSLIGGRGKDTLLGENDDDTLVGDDGKDWLYGGTGNDIVQGGDDNDIAFGDAGDDTVRGGEGNDVLFGGRGTDIITASGGSDELHGNKGDDTLRGGADADILRGGHDADTLDGQGGHDTLYGNRGSDTLYGGNGDDTLYGNKDADQLYGGNGQDTLYGGWADDQFHMGSVWEDDQIMDFERGDQIHLEGGLSFHDLTLQDRGSHYTISDGSQGFTVHTSITLSESDFFFI